MITRKLTISVLTFASWLNFVSSIHAQVGNDNPTGSFGQFNGNVTTGGSYDPYTGNVNRTVTDLVVAGAVGEYGLSYSRTYNSRDAWPWTAGWHHSYDWQIESVEVAAGQPVPYTVNFPDGRVEKFSGSLVGGALRAGAGTFERFKPIATGGLCYLLLPDGGKVEFSAVVTGYYDPEVRVNYFTYDFTTRAIVDPHGLRTTFSYNADATLSRVTEPAGRYIQFNYAGGLLASIQGSDGRVVYYTYATQTFSPGTYPYTVLTGVAYFGSPAQYTASYTYQGPNVGSTNGPPLLKTCDDAMYAGPMKQISYTYATANNPDGTAPVFGQILSENHPSGVMVSSLAVNGNTRTETRGDGPVRTFTYAGGKLTSSTDFKNVSASQTYDSNGFVSSATDRRGNTTNFTADALTGKPTLVTLPLTPFDGGVRPTVQTVYGSASCPDPNNRDGNNPYYPYSIKNERNFTTTFLRDANKRVTQISYPNGGYETFSYNGFGQVTSHRLTSGGTESFAYDGRGLKTSYTPPVTPSDPNPGAHPTLYAYDGSDRLSQVTDPRGNQTWYAYNARGQVTRTTHHDGSYAQASYNGDGTISWTADENHPGAATDPSQRTRFTYDDYKRVLSVLLPGDSQPTTFNYARDFVNSYVHTTSNLKGAWSPMGKAIHYLCDENWQRTIVRDGAGSGDDAWTYFGYDVGGNLTSVQDPRGNVRTYAYDQRNRRTSTTDPAPFNNQVTSWEYDAAGNNTKETRPDSSSRSWVYDNMNRLYWTYGFMNEGTAYLRDSAGNVTQMIDAKNSSYFFGYDLMNRKVSATYPQDATGLGRNETWHYDLAGNMDSYVNPAGQTKTIAYDNRNRPTTASWGAGDSANTTTAYDAASRVTSVTTPLTNVTFGYDNANRKKDETQTVYGYAPHSLHIDYDPDGNRDVIYTEARFFAAHYTYTGRGQIKTMSDANTGGQWFSFIYDANGNLTWRQNWTGNDEKYGYDQLNRTTMTEGSWGSGQWAFARTWYQYDSLSREVAEWRDEQVGKGERYGYDPIGQLRSAIYNADYVWTGSPSNWTRSVTYDADALNRTGANAVNDNGTALPFAANAINQYVTVGGYGMAYDPNFNISSMGGSTIVYDKENRLTSISVGGTNYAQFTYDGLGRCLKRTVSGVSSFFLQDGWSPVVEYDANNNFSCWNLYGPLGPDDIILKASVSGAVLFYQKDRRGSVTFITDGGSSIRERYTYDAFGLPTVTDGNGANPRNYSLLGNRFMFTGREWLDNISAYDYRTRFYQPTLGRFLQPDPTGFAAGDMNLFRYCGGDPVNRTDPFGLKQTPVTAPYKPNEPKAPAPTHNFGPNGYTPTGSNIPQTVAGTWNGGSWDLSTHDAINGTHDVGSFVLVGGLGNGRNGGSAEGGGATFISTSTPLGRALELGTRALDAIAKEPKVKEGLEGGGVFFENERMSREFGTPGRMIIHLLPGAIGTFHVHHLIGPDPYAFSDFDEFNYVHKRPDWVHLIGILDGPPGQFTIRAYIPDQGDGNGSRLSWHRANDHTPGF